MQMPKILIVNDDSSTLLALKAILSNSALEYGYEILEAKSGEEALRLVLKHQFAVIILDVSMPGIDGFETAQLIHSRATSAYTPIIFITAYYEDEIHRLKGYELGAVDFLLTPILPQILRSKVEVFVELAKKTLILENKTEELAALNKSLKVKQYQELKRHNELLKLEVEDRKLAEREVNEINRKKDEFLATLAHELRNPLAPIRNSVEVLGVLEKLTPKQTELLNIISRQTDQMVRLVDDLLDVSRISLGKILLQPADLAIDEVIQAAIESCNSLITNRGHTLNVTVNKKGLYVHGDKVRLVQIVSNLLNNAAKFTPQGGLITLAVDQEDDVVNIKITDNGIGLSKQQVETIFDLFVQHGRVQDKAQEGLGIGLSLVKKLTELHGGEIIVESAGIGLGSTFIIKLKTITVSKGVNQPPADSNEAKVSKILVIDDNIDAATTLVELLGIFGHEVQSAYTGKDGLKIAKTFRPQIVFLDIGLPDMYGYEVAELIRKDEHNKDCYLIALTGYGTDNDKQLAMEAGFDFHLTKPLNLSKIKFLNLGF
jgi:signal transduction histidine kinase